MSGRWRDRPLRTRLVAVAALTVAVAVSGVMVVAYVIVRHELIGQLDRQLRSQADRLGTLHALGVRDGDLTLNRGGPGGIGSLRLRFGDQRGYGQYLPPTGPPEVPADQGTLPVTATDRAIASGKGAARFRDTDVGGNPIRLLTAPASGGGAMQVALPRGAVDDQLRRLTLAFAGLGAAGLAVAIGLGWTVSRRVLAPVGQLTEAAERIAATRDLTHRIGADRRDEIGRLANSFDSMLSALQQSVTAQRQLVADASHELRTPLASLRTNVEVLHRVAELPEHAREQVLTAIVEQLGELTTLVGDVVELARGDEPVGRLTEVAFDRIVGAAVDRAARHWPRIGFAAELALVTVRADAARLDRAVTNLLDNAAKFAGTRIPAGTGSPPEVVEVSLAADGTLTVRDHGPGIPEEALPHVFDRFYRADQARALPGSGLGLAIVAQVAASHHGRAEIVNAEGGGVAATLWLPPIPENLL
jgi:two-component system sensor histidine kinase MprB